MGRSGCEGEWDAGIPDQAAAQVRAQKYEQALQSYARFDQFVQEQRKAGNHNFEYRGWDYFFLAIAHHYLKHADEARKNYDLGMKCLKQFEQPAWQALWTERIETEALQREAANLMGVVGEKQE